MRKKIFFIIAAVITALSIPVFASAQGNTMTISDAQAYISSNLSHGYLSFESDNITYEIEISALKDFYYNSDIKYYLFKSNGITVRADKNGFFDFDLNKVTFSASTSGFNVIYYYNNGSQKVLEESNMPVLYTIDYPQANSRTAVRFGDRLATVLNNENGTVVFETNFVGGFSVIDFEFNDVKDPAKWYYNYVNSAGALGIMDGMGENNYEPKTNVTRAQLAAMIVKSTEDIISYRIDPKYSFTDVQEGKWYYEYVMKCASLGIVDGVGDGMYNPLAGATREEIATVIARFIKLIGSYGNTDLPVIDTSAMDAELAELYIDSSSIHNYAKESVLICNKLGIMQGDSEGFRARSKIVRSECAKIFYLINRQISELK